MSFVPAITPRRGTYSSSPEHRSPTACRRESVVTLATEAWITRADGVERFRALARSSNAFFDSGILFGGLFTGGEIVKTDEQAAIWGSTAGDQYDPGYHLACDMFENLSLEA